MNATKLTADSASTVELEHPTDIWFDTEESLKSSCGYCIDRIKQGILADDNASEVGEVADADLIHLNTIPFRRRDIRAVSADAPVIATQHGGYQWWQSRRELLKHRKNHMFLLVRGIFRATSHLPERIVFSLPYTRKQAVESGGVPESKTDVIPLGCGSEYRDATATETDSPFILVVVNNDNERKNIPTIIRTMEMMPAVRFVLPGKMWGSYEGDLPDNADVTGFVSESKLIDYYNRASALYLPTLYEGFGLPFVEAMSCGTAVVTTRCGAAREVCSDAAAYVKDPTDAAEHTTLLWRMITDDRLREQYEDESSDRAQAFSWERTTGQYLDLYNEVLYQ